MATAKTIKMVISSTIGLIDLVHSADEKMAEVAGFDGDEALNMGLAVREAVINAIVHGNGQDPALEVGITMTANSDSLKATIRDHGAGFDPTQTPDPTADPNILLPSGRGLLLMRAFVDDVEFNTTGPGTEITLTKHIRSEQRQQS